MNKETIVKCLDVVRTYTQGETEVRALGGVDLEVPSKSFLSLCGPSGSGKTTLLNLIGGIDTPTSGEIIVDGQRIDSLSSTDRAAFRLNNLGFIFQSYNLIPVLSAQENVEFVMELQGVDTKERRDRAKDLLNDVGLSGMESRRPAELSGGQQQRVAVARAIVSNPRIVLADEPTANLDSKTADRLLIIMREMNEKRGVTFIFSTHDKLVMSYAKRLVHLRDGKIESDEVIS